jgi:hypothetical protein
MFSLLWIQQNKLQRDNEVYCVYLGSMIKCWLSTMLCTESHYAVSLLKWKQDTVNTAKFIIQISRT